MLFEMYHLNITPENADLTASPFDDTSSNITITDSSDICIVPGHYKNVIIQNSRDILLHNAYDLKIYDSSNVHCINTSFERIGLS